MIYFVIIIHIKIINDFTKIYIFFKSSKLTQLANSSGHPTQVTNHCILLLIFLCLIKSLISQNVLSVGINKDNSQSKNEGSP